MTSATKLSAQSSNNGTPVSSVGIRELKARASAIVQDVKSRHVTYAVTKHGAVEALIVPVDVAQRLLDSVSDDQAWQVWQGVVEQLRAEADGALPSALQALGEMRR